MNLSSNDTGPSAAEGGGGSNADEFLSRQISTTIIDQSSSRARVGRIAIVAASLAVAAALGSIAGALAGSALSRPSVERPIAPALNANALNERLAQLSADLAALKSNFDSANRNTGAQLSRMSERIERAEKAQAEPAAKIATMSEAIERMERQSLASADVTGSIAEKQEDRPPFVNGWVLREVDEGRAIVQSRLGFFEVGPGSSLPGIGRVERIKRENGRWVVVTPKGLIVSASARR